MARETLSVQKHLALSYTVLLWYIVLETYSVRVTESGHE